VLVPAIEVMGGRAVRRVRGLDEVADCGDPVELAHTLGRLGEVAVVDLDAAVGRGENEAAIRRMVRVAACRVGGGIRTEDKARRLLRLGAHRVVIGTAACRDLLSRLPRSRVVVAVDAMDGEVVTEGRTQRTGRSPIETIQVLAPYASGFLLTFVDSDGGQDGVPMDRVPALRGATALPLAVSGGVATVEEVRALDAAGVDVQSAAAVPDGALDPADAFVACMDFSEGPIPAVFQDAAGQVLLVARCDPDTLRESLATGRCPFGSLTQKGIEMVRAVPDCGRHALVFRVVTRGPACRRGTWSCFGEGSREFSLARLCEVIQERRADPKPGSYTAFLFEKDDRIPRKLNEELYELLTARGHDDVVWEAADVLYFLLAYLVKNGVSLEEVVAELRGRER